MTVSIRCYFDTINLKQSGMAASIRYYIDTINLKQSGFYTTYSFKLLISEQKYKYNLKNRESGKK